MPTKAKISRDMILYAAFALVREEGDGAQSATAEMPLELVLIVVAGGYLGYLLRLSKGEAAVDE